jgi:hypothetical protein
MHECDTQPCAWHKAAQDKYRRAYHQIIVHAYTDAELVVIFEHVNTWMLAGGPLTSNLDDQPPEVLAWAALVGERFAVSAKAYMDRLYGVAG